MKSEKNVKYVFSNTARQTTSTSPRRVRGNNNIIIIIYISRASYTAVASESRVAVTRLAYRDNFKD